MFRSRVPNGWSLAAILMLLTACSADDAPPTAEGRPRTRLTVYFQGPISGWARELGIHAHRAAQLRFQELHEDPSFPATVAVKVADIQTEPPDTEALERAVRDPRAAAIIGPSFSGETQALADHFEEAGLPFVTHHEGGPDAAEQGWGSWYRTVATYEEHDLRLAEIVAARHDRVFLVQEDNVTRARRTMGETLLQAGAEKVWVGRVDSQPPGFRFGIGNLIANAHPDALVVQAPLQDRPRLIRQIQRVAPDRPIYTNEWNLSEELIAVSGIQADLFLTCRCNLYGRGDFHARYEAAYGESPVPFYAAEAYDVATLIGEGIRSAVDGGAEDTAGIRAGIKAYLDRVTLEAPFEGVAKDVAFDPENHDLAAVDRRELVFVYRLDRGEIVPLGTAAEQIEA